MDDKLPIIISFIIALFGSLGGIAALLKVNADNSNTVAEGASKVVDMMDKRLDDQEERIKNLEGYLEHFNGWADRLLSILERAVGALPDALRAEFEHELVELKSSRPRRNKNV